MRSFLFAICAAAIVAATPAQSLVHLLGTVRANAGGYLLEGTSVRLQSTAINLQRHNGQLVDLFGTLVTLQPAPLVEVTTIQGTDRRLLVDGNRIGQDLTLRIDAPLATYFYYYFSFVEGFLPLDPYWPLATGTLLTDLSQTFTLGWGEIWGSWAGSLRIPDDPRLIGARVLFQAAVHEIPGPVRYLNAQEVVFRR